MIFTYRGPEREVPRDRIPDGDLCAILKIFIFYSDVTDSGDGKGWEGGRRVLYPWGAPSMHEGRPLHLAPN